MSRRLEDTLHMDAVAAFVTTMALIAIVAALTVRLVRQRLYQFTSAPGEVWNQFSAQPAAGAKNVRGAQEPARYRGLCT
jgi:hypothetical protein